jgi:hypothetical protein
MMKIDSIPPFPCGPARGDLVMDGAIDYLNVVPSSYIETIKLEILDFKIAKDEVVVTVRNLPTCFVGTVDSIKNQIFKNEISPCPSCLYWSIACGYGVRVPKRDGFSWVS